jgi:hypothetical protein
MLRFIQLASLVCLLTTAEIASAQSEIVVEFDVRGPDGQPIADTAVEVIPAERHPFPSAKGAAKQATTDADGRARVVLTEAANRLRVSVPGAGFAVTDGYDPTTRGTIIVGLPRLVPFASITGVLPDSLRGNGVTLDPQAYLAGRRTVKPIDIGPDGKFTFRDLRPGRYMLQPKRNGEPVGVIANITLAPGEARVITSDAFYPDPFIAPPEDTKPDVPSAKAAVTMKSKLAEPSPDAFPFAPYVWYAGTVRDQQGRGMSNIKVFLSGHQATMLDARDVVFMTETDHHGRWEIRSVDRLKQVSGGRLLAYHYDHPLAFASCRTNDSASLLDEVKPVLVPERYDLVVPERERGGTLRVRVLQSDGTPAAKATVAVAQGGEHAFSRLGRGYGADFRTLDDVLQPEKTTDSLGRVHFNMLTPGLYALVAAGGETTARGLLNGARGFDDPPPDEAFCHGIAVRAGEFTDYVVQLGKRRGRMEVVVQDAAGRPVAEQHPSLELGLPNDQGGGTQGLQLDAGGRGSFWRFRSGLYTARIRYTSGPIHSYPVQEGPFSEAQVTLAHSPLLQGFPPAVLTASDRTPGSLKIELRDAAGRPARGAVKSTNQMGETFLAGGTDDDGVLMWRNVSPGGASFTAYLPDMKSSPCRETSPFAGDDALVGRKLLLQQGVNVGYGRTAVLRFEPQPVGYIRGRVRPAANRTTADYRLADPDGGHRCSSFRIYYDATTGEFLLGPLPLGPTRVTVNERQSSAGGWNGAAKTVDVRNDRVEFVELVPKQRTAAAAPPTDSPNDSPADGEPRGDVRTGRIVAADGKTPIVGAYFAIYPRDAKHSGYRNAADSDGRFTYRPGTLPLSVGLEVTGPYVAAAWLPGSFAPTIVPLPATADEELTIVLDRGQRLNGRVTIGGGSVGDIGNRLQVLLSPDQPTPLDANHYDDLIPSADGSFEIGGLAAGTYRSQAALDGIWLSTTQEVVIADATAPEPITLDIPRPGPPSVLKCVDLQGRPVAGVTVTLRRPDGPLMKRLWPKTFHADARGVLHLPPLEAGKHTFTTSHSKLPYEITLEPIPKTGGKPYEKKIVID